MLLAAHLLSLAFAPIVRHSTRAQRSSPRMAVTGDDASLFASLRARQEKLDEASEELTSRWRSAECSSSIRAALDNWVRRLDVDWPLAAIGTAQGGVYIADLNSGETLAKVTGAHPGYVDGTESEMQTLYGDFDGGGLTAIIMQDNLIVSAGREGGAKLWRLSRPDDDRQIAIAPAGELEGDAIVSSALIRPEEVWTASLDGALRRWELSAHSSATACVRTVRTQDALLCVAGCEERGLIACGDAAGAVRLYTAAGELSGEWKPLAFDGSRGYKGSAARSIELVRVGEATCVVAGGDDGSLHYRWLADDSSATFDETRQGRELLPAHNGAVVALRGRGSGADACGLLISGARDGTMRVWDLAPAAEGEEPTCLFGLGGYKVWLGSICTDGRRLISDGADNTVIIHDFGAEQAEPNS